jgi:hypothetical protein
MNQALRAGLLAFSLLGVGVCDAGPGPEIKHWIAYWIAGNVNHPYPGLYFSPQHFETTPGVSLTVLSEKQYKILETFTQAQIAPGSCPRPGPVPREGVWYSVGMTIYTRQRTQNCVLPQTLGCKFLTGALTLPGVNWTKQELIPYREFAAEVGCRYALAVANKVTK